MSGASPKDIKNLEVQAVIFAVMCALAGVYFTLFLIAFFSTFQRKSRTMRIVTMALFIVNLTHLISRSFDMNEARRIPQPVLTEELYRWTIPLRVVETISTTLAGAISDGLLAYRFWAIFDRQRWALYIPAVAVSINTLLGIAEALINLAIYRRNGAFVYGNTIGIDVLKINATWGWSMFVTNTILTLSMCAKIIQHARALSKAISHMSGQIPLSTVAEAIIESALVTWIGLLFYEIASLAPEGHYTNNLDVGTVGICILPFLFCLITARNSLLRTAETKSIKLSDVVFANSFATTGIRRGSRSVVLTSPTYPDSSKEMDIEKHIDFSVSTYAI